MYIILSDLKYSLPGAPNADAKRFQRESTFQEAAITGMMRRAESLNDISHNLPNARIDAFGTLSLPCHLDFFQKAGKAQRLTETSQGLAKFRISFEQQKE